MKALLILACASVVTLADNSSLTLEQRIARLEGINRDLSRQISLQAFYDQEMLRSDGNSGIIETRLRKIGPKNIYTDSPSTNDAFMDMHDHPELERTVGLGELNVVMNGYHFRTRHNDYELIMPSSKTQNYHATEKIPFPPVPGTVLKQRTVMKQIQEMREYFKAFASQKPDKQNYNAYFLPNLCYMEGSWTNLTNEDGVEEPFDNDRHHFDASSWSNLLGKAQTHAYTGSHSRSGNLAFLPMSMYRVKDGKPFFAQWQYRILCHPIKGKLPTSNFQPVDDLSQRLPRQLTSSEALNHPGQRFILNSKDYDRIVEPSNSLIDSLMIQIPGKNNYKAQEKDFTTGKGFASGSLTTNTGFYHRYYRTATVGAMGTKSAYRGYNNANNWMAQTTHDQIIKYSEGKCKGKSTKKTAKSNCANEVSFTFAIPLEIIYTTPLARWNPYGLPEQEERQNLPVPNLHAGEGTEKEIKTYYKKEKLVPEPKRIPVNDVTEGGKRNGSNTRSTAFKGASALHFYKTPREFYSPNENIREVNVLNSKGQIKQVVSSGIRTFTPFIPGVGRIRLRYPLAPMFSDGQGVTKELNALKDLALNPRSHLRLYEETPCSDGNVTSKGQIMLEYKKIRDKCNTIKILIHLIVSASEGMTCQN